MTDRPTARRLDQVMPDRDRWSRALCAGSPDETLQAYQRYSKNPLDDAFGLIPWTVKGTVGAIFENRQLVDQGLMLGTGPARDKGLQQLITAAQSTGWMDEAKERGQRFHAASEMWDLGEDTSGLSAESQEFLRAWEAAMVAAELTPAVVEINIADHTRRKFGTSDRFVWTKKGDLVCLDLKTNAKLDPRYALSPAVQTAGYNAPEASPYCAERGPMAWNSPEVGLEQPRSDLAIIAHFPGPNPSDWSLLSVDTTKGREYMDLGLKVTAARADRTLLKPIYTAT